jgi:hypothetical protein
LEAVVESWVTPWRNHFDAGLESVECEFETDLIVAFACAAVGDSHTTLFLCDCDLSAGNHWPGERCAEEIDVLIDSVARNGWVAELFNELDVESAADR